MKENYEWLNLIPYGWVELARKMIEECETINPTYTIEDMKEKWGCLDVYSYFNDTNVDDKAIEAIEQKYRELSKVTCCKCGKAATKISMGYVLPWCDECANKNKIGNYKTL